MVEDVDYFEDLTAGGRYKLWKYQQVPKVYSEWVV